MGLALKGLNQTTVLYFLVTEDVDPTIGRFRNLVSTEIIIPNKVVFDKFLVKFHFHT